MELRFDVISHNLDLANLATELIQHVDNLLELELAVLVDVPAGEQVGSEPAPHTR